MKERRLEAALLPDVMVVCGDLEPGATSTNEPVALVEVMSAGSEGRDHFEKWQIYQRLSALRHYVLVSRDKAHVEIFSRQDGLWSAMEVLDGLDAVLDMPAIGTSIPLRAIYRRVLTA